MPASKRKNPSQRGRFIQTICYLTPEQRERLRATCERMQVPAQRFLRAGLDLVLDNPGLVQRPPASDEARR